MTEIIDFKIIKKERDKTLKPIKLVKLISDRIDFEDRIITCSEMINDYDYVMLISKSSNHNGEYGYDYYDTIACWNKNYEDFKDLFFGFWNDGVVER